jgi:hypothetical protein
VVRTLCEIHDHLTAQQLGEGFIVDSQRYPLVNPRRGIFKPADNRWLREAFENQVPIIYFLGIAPGRYQAILPAFIGGWDRSSKRADITFGLPGQTGLTPPATEIERRYALQTVKQRLHQASFREAVIGATEAGVLCPVFPSPCFSTPLISSKIDMSCLDSLWFATVSRSRKSITRPSTLISSESTRISGCMFQSVCSFNMTVQC